MLITIVVSNIYIIDLRLYLGRFNRGNYFDFSQIR